MFAPDLLSASWTGGSSGTACASFTDEMCSGPLLNNTTPQKRVESIRALNDSMNDHLPMDKRGGALALAAMAGNPHTIKALLDSGEDASQRDVAGRTALERAALIGNMEAIEVLLSCDLARTDLVAFINSAGSKRSNITPLMRAAKQGHVHVVSLLLSLGAEVNARRKDTGTTALHEAAMHGREQCVKILLAGGADACVQDEGGSHALHFAAQGWSLFCDQPGKVDVAGRLLDASVDVNARNNKGQSASDIAQNEGHTEFTMFMTIRNRLNSREHASLDLDLEGIGIGIEVPEATKSIALFKEPSPGCNAQTNLQEAKAPSA